MREIIIIAAVAENRGIGLNGDLAIRLPADLAHFKALTIGHPVIMGRKTWESLPEARRPLARRRNLVISSDKNYKASGAEVVTSLEEALHRTLAANKVFIIGGASIYHAAMPVATKLELTEIDFKPMADTFFPEVDFKKWKIVDMEPHNGFNFVTYEKD